MIGTYCPHGGIFFWLNVHHFHNLWATNIWIWQTPNFGVALNFLITGRAWAILQYLFSKKQVVLYYSQSQLPNPLLVLCTIRAVRRGGGASAPPFLGHQWSGNWMLPQKLGFAISVAQKLWNWRPFSQKIPLRGQYIAILMLIGLNQLKFAPPPLFKSLGTALDVIVGSSSQDT